MKDFEDGEGIPKLNWSLISQGEHQGYPKRILIDLNLVIEGHFLSTQIRALSSFYQPCLTRLFLYIDNVSLSTIKRS